MLPTPEQLQSQCPLDVEAAQTVQHARAQLRDILDRKDNRLIVIVGPCSIHHPESALRYAKKLQLKIQEHAAHLCIIMRTYVEKSRTALGWKGLINDPDLNDSFQIEKGLLQARTLLAQINTMGVPVAAEIVNPLIAPYLSDLISWTAIGARSVENLLHRELASHLPMPVGFKNSTQGIIQTAVDAVQTAKQAHHFLHPDHTGHIRLIQSSGNPYAHVVLRGSEQKTNYDTHSILETRNLLRARGLNTQVIIDCSHGNSQKNHLQQMAVANELAARIEKGDKTICGIMLESYLVAGKQAWYPQKTPRADQSITDACMGWDETAALLDRLSNAIQITQATSPASQLLSAAEHAAQCPHPQ